MILAEFRPSALDTGADETYRWCGMTLVVRKEQHEKLRRWLGHQWRNIGWIGYLLPKDSEKTELSVWLYFSPEQRNRRNASIQILKQKFRGNTVKASEKGMDLIVSEPASRVKDEREWFSNTLQVVLAEDYQATARERK